VLCAFPGHLCGRSCAWSCLPFPRSLVAAVPPWVLTLTVTLILIFVLPGWVLFCGAGVFLTSAARSGGEVRKTEAERSGQHPARPAAVAADLADRTGPARADAGVRGLCVARVRAALAGMLRFFAGGLVHGMRLCAA
jgi:hypothetical protein